MSVNSGLLPQNKASIGSNLSASFNCTKMCANDPSTFVENQGYHLEEEVDLSRLVLGTSGGSGQRMAFERLEATSRRRATLALGPPPS